MSVANLPRRERRNSTIRSCRSTPVMTVMGISLPGADSRIGVLPANYYQSPISGDTLHYYLGHARAYGDNRNSDYVGGYSCTNYRSSRWSAGDNGWRYEKCLRESIRLQSCNECYDLLNFHECGAKRYNRQNAAPRHVIRNNTIHWGLKCFRCAGIQRRTNRCSDTGECSVAEKQLRNGMGSLVTTNAPG